MRFNGNAFFVEIENLQTTIFDPSIVNLFFSDNAAALSEKNRLTIDGSKIVVCRFSISTKNALPLKRN